MRRPFTLLLATAACLAWPGEAANRPACHGGEAGASLQPPGPGVALNGATGYANASLILALASLVLGPFGAVPAIICGHKALSRMRKNPAIEGFGRALSGTILGYCFLVVFVVVFGGMLLLFLSWTLLEGRVSTG